VNAESARSTNVFDLNPNDLIPTSEKVAHGKAYAL